MQVAPKYCFCIIKNMKHYSCADSYNYNNNRSTPIYIIVSYRKNNRASRHKKCPRVLFRIAKQLLHHMDKSYHICYNDAMKKGGKKEKNDTMVTRKKCLIDVTIVGTVCFFLGFFFCHTAYPILYRNKLEADRKNAEATLDYKIQELKGLQGQTPAKNQSQNKSASHSKHTVYDITPETMLAEVNKIRAEHGVAPLQLSPALNKSAQEKCDDMATNNYYDHQNPTTKLEGYEIAMRNLNNVYGYYSENLNITYGSDKGADDVNGDRLDERTVFNGDRGWMKSEPHAKAILDPRYTLTGFGKCTRNDHGEWGKWYFVEHFYSPTN